MARVLAAVLALALLAAAPSASVAAAARTDQPRGVAAPPAAPLPAPPGTTTLLSRNRGQDFPDQRSLEPSMSANGQLVAFSSYASDLVANDEAGSLEVFLLNRRTGRITRAPLPDGYARNPGAAQDQPAISADGTVVAYRYRPFVAGTLDGPDTLVVAWEWKTGRVEVVSLGPKREPAFGAREPSVSADGRYIAYTSIFDWPTDDASHADDVFRYDRQARRTVLVSTGPEGRPIAGVANSPSISGDGNLVTFVSDGNDTIVHEATGPDLQVYLRDVQAGVTRRVSVAADGGPADAGSFTPVISGNGGYVAFGSSATNLTVEGGAGLFRRDLSAGRTVLISVTPDGQAAKGGNLQPSMTPDGNFVAWTSTASGLVPETAGRVAPAATARLSAEVYLRDVDAGETILVSVSRSNTGGGGLSSHPSVAGAGRFVAFSSDSPNLVRGDGNQVADVFLRDLPPVPVVSPGTLDLGAGAVGTQGPPLAATLVNRGWSALTVKGASTTGANRHDFHVVADGCTGLRLARGEACTVSVSFRPQGKGTRTGTLAIADGYAGSPRTVRLRGEASKASLVLDPPIGQPGIVTVVTGSGFPKGARIALRWSAGITPTLGVIEARDGTFTTQVLVFHNDVAGPRDLIAEPADGASFPAVSASMLVVKPWVVPPRFDIARFIDIPLVMVIRG